VLAGWKGWCGVNIEAVKMQNLATVDQKLARVRDNDISLYVLLILCGQANNAAELAEAVKHALTAKPDMAVLLVDCVAIILFQLLEGKQT
jgi:hypothetical protein